MMLIQRVGLLLLVLLALAWPGSRTARANGAPVRVVLSYLQGISNWGPTDGTGVVEVLEHDGEVDGSIVGLPQLQGEVYFGWVVNTQTGETYPTGSFATDASKTANFKNRLPDEIPDHGWNLYLVSIEKEGATPDKPSQQHSLAGYFPAHGTTTAAPAQLPHTGTGGIGTDGKGQLPAWALLVGLMAAVAAAGAVLVRLLPARRGRR